MKKMFLSRRKFMRATATAVGALAIVPRHVVAGSRQISPNEKVNIAAIGIGGIGKEDLEAVRGENIVALCDVDQQYAGPVFEKYPQAKRYRDFRVMLDEMSDQIDAVMVATPDHTHAVATMAAIKRGKHVYCEKPLAHSVYECRQLAKAAKDHNIVSQLGNQGHSFESIRNFCEWIWDGAIGKVHTIHSGSHAICSGIDDLPQLQQKHEVPQTLDWNLWLGPAQFRPYHPCYLPGRWRGWTPFGEGTVGDWTCHVLDGVFWALDLGSPKSIQAQVKDYDPKTQGDVFPKGDVITYEFPANAKRGPITMHWHSGTEPIPRPAELEPGQQLVDRTGAVVLGDKGGIMYGGHGCRAVQLIPEAKNDAYKRPPKTIPRAKEHHQDWLEAIRTGRKAGSDFSYGGPLSEIAMLGVIALKLPGTKLEWDTEKMQFTNCSEANQHVNPPYREGWTL